MHIFKNLVVLSLFFISLVFSNTKDIILIENDSGNYSRLNFKSVSKKLEKKEKLLQFINNSFEVSNDINFPSHTTFYQIENDRDINVSYTINNSTFEDYESIVGSIYHINSSEYNGIYPPNNLIVSEPMVFRGVLVKQITFIPYQINFDDNTVRFFNDVDINVEEFISSENRNFSHTKLSKLFEPLYEDMIVNYESSNREEDYQKPSVLYICGGSSIDNPYVEQLLEWRHKTGYIVNAVSTSDIGGSGSNTVKNYIQNAYNNWENPPEIVGLIGDTGGSYSIGYFTESWSGDSGEGDWP